MVVVWIHIFKVKEYQKKRIMQDLINDNAIFCYQSKEKVLSSNTFGKMQVWTKKIKMENFIDDDLEKRIWKWKR